MHVTLIQLPCIANDVVHIILAMKDVYFTILNYTASIIKFTTKMWVCTLLAKEVLL